MLSLDALRQHPTLRTAARYGCILGAINGLFAILDLFVPTFGTSDGLLSLIAGIALLTMIGIDIGRQKGAATPAMFAGILASATAWAVNALVVLVLTLAFVGKYRAQLVAVARSQNQPATGLSSGTVIAGNLLLLVFFLLVALAFGAVLGGLGGLIGRRSARSGGDAVVATGATSTTTVASEAASTQAPTPSAATASAPESTPTPTATATALGQAEVAEAS